MDNVEEYWDIYSLVRGRERPLQTHSVYLRFPASVRIVPSIRCHCALGIPGGMSAERDASNGLQNTFESCGTLRLRCGGRPVQRAIALAISSGYKDASVAFSDRPSKSRRCELH